MSALQLAGQRAITEASRLWDLDVYDPPRSDKSDHANASRTVIDRIIKRNGWGFALPHGHYEGNGPPQWCGMFAGYCWAAAGLDPAWLQVWFASTMRLGAWANYQPWNEHRNPRPADADDRRLIAKLDGGPLPFDPQAGDIVIVGDGTPAAGDHVTLVVRYDAAARAFETISGNGGGVGPHGNRREGISRATYKIGAAGYRAMWLMRPAFGDLIAEAP